MSRVGREGGGGYRRQRQAPYIEDTGTATQPSRSPTPRNNRRAGGNPEAGRKIARELRKQAASDLWESLIPVVIRDHPNPALVPVGDSDIYTNPPGPVDPQNCELWPDSPFCGGTGVDRSARRFFDISPQIEIAGGCEICISLSPTIGLVSLPPTIYCYRKPECQVPVDRFQKSPPGLNLGGPPPYPRLDHIDSIPKYWVITYEAEAVTQYTRNYPIAVDWVYTHSKNSIDSAARALLLSDSTGTVQTPEGPQGAGFYPQNTLIPLIDTRIRSGSLSTYSDGTIVGAAHGEPGEYTKRPFYPEDHLLIPFQAWRLVRYYAPNNFPPISDAARWFTSRYPDTSSLLALNNLAIPADPYVIWGSGQLIKDFVSWLYYSGNRTQTINYSNGSDLITIRTKITVCPLLDHQCDQRPPAAPPQPPDKMTCDCQAQEELLRLIYKKLDDAPQDSALLQRVADSIGIDEYPASVPASFVTRSGKPEGQIQISNLSSLLGQFIRYFDEVLGHWEQTVTISDTDLTEEGDQSTTIKLPNVAETLSEGIGLLVNLTTLLQANLETSVATLAEAGASHRVGIEARSIAEGIEDFLAYEYEEVRAVEPFAFDPGQEEFSKLLKPKEVALKVHRFNDRQDFKSYNTEYLQAVAMIRAFLWKNIDPNEDIQQQIRDWIGEAESLLDDQQEGENSDFDTFLNKAELGFFLEPGSTNLGTPYGREYERRPRIREIGSDQTD